jgi:putative glycosyltransferase (TIGR04372 family)
MVSAEIHETIRRVIGDIASADMAKEMSGLLDRLVASPDDYDANARLGLMLSLKRDHLLEAEPLLAAALAQGQQDALTPKIVGTLGEINLRRANVADAVALFHWLVEKFPGHANYLYLLGDALTLGGNIAAASQAFSHAMTMLDHNARSIADQLGEKPTRILAPASTISLHMGEMAATVDMFLKARALGLIEDFEAILLAPPGSTANMPLAECFAPHVRVVSEADEIAEAEKKYGACPYFANYLPINDDIIASRDLAYGAIQAAWVAAAKPPIVEFPDSQMAECRLALESLGIGPNDWFVCLHVRERGFYEENSDVQGTQNDLRNPDIQTYLPAVKAITDRGGWVVRLGDESMSALPVLDHVVDYAHSQARTPWLDLYCIAACKFVLGSPSGPTDVARVFDAPVLATDFLPLGGWPFGARDLFLPKIRISRETGRPLTLAEGLKPPLSGNINPLAFENHGIDIVENTAEEIVEGVADMFARLDGSLDPDAATKALLSAFSKQADPHGVGQWAPVAPSYLRRHPEWVDAD